MSDGEQPPLTFGKHQKRERLLPVRSTALFGGIITTDKNMNEDQPRVPAGSPEGGQFASEFFSKKGNAGGFTSDGRTVSGGYSPKVKAWKVWTDEYARDVRHFPTAAEADAHARKLIDPVVTEKKKWW